MKRDLNLLRSILLRIESIDAHSIDSSELLDLHQNPLMIYLHLHLLDESGFLVIFDHKSYHGGEKFLISHITSAGYDYLDSVRDDSTWRSICAKLKFFGGNISPSLVKEIGVSLIKAQLGI